MTIGQPLLGGPTSASNHFHLGPLLRAPYPIHIPLPPLITIDQLTGHRRVASVWWIQKQLSAGPPLSVPSPHPSILPASICGRPGRARPHGTGPVTHTSYLPGAYRSPHPFSCLLDRPWWALSAPSMLSGNTPEVAGSQHPRIKIAIFLLYILVGNSPCPCAYSIPLLHSCQCW